MKVIVKDFQSIEDVKLDIKGFTLLVGESSQGKSATLRALEAAVSNRFRAGQVRNGTDKANIGIKFDEGNVLRVDRPAKGGVTMNLDGVEYSKLGRAVPREVEGVVNMSDVAGDGVDYNLNFHNQFEKPLLLEFSQPKVMELLSASEALDDLGVAKDALSARRTELKGSFGSLNGLLNGVKVDLSEVDAKLDRYGDDVEALRGVVGEYEALVGVASGLEGLIGVVKEREALYDKVMVLRGLLSDADALMTEWCKKSADADGLNGLKSLMVDRIALDGVYKDCKARKDVCGGIVSLDGDKSAKGAEIGLVGDLKGLLEQRVVIENRIKELKRFVVDGICPICGNKVSKCNDYE